MTDMTKDEIIERLIELDVDHNPRDNKAVLEELLGIHDPDRHEPDPKPGDEDLEVETQAAEDQSLEVEANVPDDFVQVTVTKAGDGKVFTGKPSPRFYERREQFWCSPETAKQLEARHYVEIED